MQSRLHNLRHPRIHRHPREGGGLVRCRKAAFINALRADRIPAFAGMA
jgi:hypothetical protein